VFKTVSTSCRGKSSDDLVLPGGVRGEVNEDGGRESFKVLMVGDKSG
jgi:hypothetical protein